MFGYDALLNTPRDVEFGVGLHTFGRHAFDVLEIRVNVGGHPLERVADFSHFVMGIDANRLGIEDMLGRESFHPLRNRVDRIEDVFMQQVQLDEHQHEKHESERHEYRDS